MSYPESTFSKAGTAAPRCKIVRCLLLVGTLLIICGPDATRGQINPGAGNSSNETGNSTKENTIMSPVYGIDMCLESDGTFSSQFCNCKGNVTNCDFSGFPGSIKNKSTIYLIGNHIPVSTKRICLCNTPPYVLLDLNSSFLPTRDLRIHRVDIFNITGHLNMQNAFNLNFNGELFISNVHYIRNLHTHEFGRGNDMKVEDVENLRCCSPINSSSIHGKPTLYMENINAINAKSSSIGGFHLWKSVILKSVQIDHVGNQGIELTNVPNVSISQCTFADVSDNGIKIKDFDNLIFAKNSVFSNKSFKPFVARSKNLGSVIFNLDNYFDALMVWDLDADYVINWFNFYWVWYSDTFLVFNTTNFPNRTISFEYNTLEHYDINETSQIPQTLGDDVQKVVFHENVLGTCNCSVIGGGVTLPESLKSSRCNINHDGRSCLVDYRHVQEKCKESHKDVNFEMCQDSSIAVFDDKFSRIKPRVSVEGLLNAFFRETIKGIPQDSFVVRTILHIAAKDVQGNTSSESSTTHARNNLALYVILSMLGIVLAVVSIGWMYKRNRNSQYRQPVGSFDLLITET